MARDREEVESASSAGNNHHNNQSRPQPGSSSQRPPLSHRKSESDSKSQSESDATSVQSHNTNSSNHHHRLSKQNLAQGSGQQHHHHHSRHHVVGGGRHQHHARANSSKALHKLPSQAAPRLSRRITSPGDETSGAVPRLSGLGSGAAATAGGSSSNFQAHRRATSEVKLARDGSASNLLQQSLSHSSLKRNRSHADVAGKRNKSSDKLKKSSSGTGINRFKGSKSQVHFDLGEDEQDEEDEWVDASGSNSPYLSRKGSITSSGPSSLRPGNSANSSRPESPHDEGQEDENEQDEHQEQEQEQEQERVPTPERERVEHKEYLTSRLLRRTPSQGAPPQMTADIAQVTPPRLSPDAAQYESSAPSTGGRDELTSRFVEAPGSGLTSEGSFYHPSRGGSHRSEEIPRRPLSAISLPQARDSVPGSPALEYHDDSALVPKTARRTAAPPAETSRTQQKLNLQRASSVLDPGQNVSGVGGVVGSSRLIGVGGPGYDGASSRDLRVGKLLERTGMEYLVVRRYQNPIVRSLNRLDRLPGMDKSKRIPRGGSTLSLIANGNKRHADQHLPSAVSAARHTRNVSMPDPRRPVTPKRVATIRANGGGSSFDPEEEARLSERLSGSSLVGGEDEEEDGVATLLRNMWDKNMELSASTD